MLYDAGEMLRLLYFTTASKRQPVKDFIEEEDVKAQAKIREVLQFFREYGFHLSDQYLRRMSGTSYLWELRAKYRGRQYRIFLARLGNDAAVLLHAIIKKTQKTPLQAIETAQERFRLVRQAQKGA